MWTFLQPSEQNTYSDIEAVYKCLEENYGAKQEDIILYGQSVGSGPTLDLAARLPRLRAVILHSPILSGLRVMYPVKRSYWFDIYKVAFMVIDHCHFHYLLHIKNYFCRVHVLTFIWHWFGAEYWQDSTRKVSCSGRSRKFPGLYISKCT